MAADPAQEVTLTLQAAAWGPEAERWLPAALAGCSLQAMRDQVERGATLLHLVAGGEVCGVFVLRVDQVADGCEGVIVAASAQLAGVDLVAQLTPALERMFVGVRRIRFHTARPGLLRSMARLGYRPREVIAYKEMQ